MVYVVFLVRRGRPIKKWGEGICVKKVGTIVWSGYEYDLYEATLPQKYSQLPSDVAKYRRPRCESFTSKEKAINELLGTIATGEGNDEYASISMSIREDKGCGDKIFLELGLLVNSVGSSGSGIFVGFFCTRTQAKMQTLRVGILEKEQK